MAKSPCSGRMTPNHAFERAGRKRAGRRDHHDCDDRSSLARRDCCLLRFIASSFVALLDDKSIRVHRTNFRRTWLQFGDAAVLQSCQQPTDSAPAGRSISDRWEKLF